MPKWVFQCTKGAFSREDKQKLARVCQKFTRPTDCPHSTLTYKLFIELGPDDNWSGGEPAEPSTSDTTISIYHAAANVRNKQEGEVFLKALDDVVRPALKPKGIRWESNVYENPRDLWRLQGMAPPDFDTDMHNRWVKENSFTYEDEDKLLRQQGYFDESRWQMPTH